MKKTVCIDLDGTLAPHPTLNDWKSDDTFNDPFPGAKEFLEELHKNFNIIIFTCRCTAGVWGKTSAHLLRNQVRHWLEKHDLPYDHIWIEPGKPVADVYVDDRAVYCDPERANKEYGMSSEQVYMCVLHTAKTRAELRPVEDLFFDDSKPALNDERKVKRDKE